MQPGTYPSPTTTHLMACIALRAWEAAPVTAQGTERFRGLQGFGEPGKAPRQRSSSSRTGDRRKRKGNLPKLLPQQPFAEGGACGLVGLGAPQVLGWDASRGPGDPLCWGLPACPWGRATVVLQRLKASRNSVHLNSKCQAFNECLLYASHSVRCWRVQGAKGTADPWGRCHLTHVSIRQGRK